MSTEHGQPPTTSAPEPLWYVPLRGLAAVAGAFLLIWLTIAYLGRPPTTSKPSLVSKIRDRHHDRNQERQADR